MKVTLEVHVPNRAIEIKHMPEGTWSIGREEGDIVLPDPKVSGVHGELSYDGTNLSFKDTGSTNGSFDANTAERFQVNLDIPLAVGSSLRMGGCRIVVKHIEGAEPSLRGRTMVAMDHQAPTPAPQVAVAQAPTPQAPVAQAPAPQAVAMQAAAPQALATAATTQGASPNDRSDRNRPFEDVRHAYPLAITDASLSTALGLVMRTMPYAIARFGILMLYALLSVVWFAITVGGMVWLGKLSPLLSWIWLGGGMTIAGAFWKLILRYTLYLLKAGHIAVLTELIVDGKVGSDDKGMFAYGKDVVTARFGQVNAMFALDLIVHGIVRAFNRTLNWLANLVPIPGLQSAVGVVNKLVHAATTYVDETMFSYTLARGDDNVYRASKDGLIYYAQNAKEVLKTGVWIVVLDYATAVLSWVFMLAPAWLFVQMVPAAALGLGSIFMFFVATVLMFNLRAAFIKPLFLVMIMTKFHVSVQNQAINLQWDERLSSASNKFRELKELAVGQGAREPAVQPAAGAAV